MSNYNWPMTLGERCIAEAERLILYAIIDHGQDINVRRGDRLEGATGDYFYGRPIPMPAFCKWAISNHRNVRLIGQEINLHIRTKDISTLRRVLYHGDTEARIKAWAELES